MSIYTSVYVEIKPEQSLEIVSFGNATPVREALLEWLGTDVVDASRYHVGGTVVLDVKTISRLRWPAQDNDETYQWWEEIEDVWGHDDAARVVKAWDLGLKTFISWS